MTWQGTPEEGRKENRRKNKEGCCTVVLKICMQIRFPSKHGFPFFIGISLDDDGYIIMLLISWFCFVIFCSECFVLLDSRCAFSWCHASRTFVMHFLLLALLSGERHWDASRKELKLGSPYILGSCGVHYRQYFPHKWRIHLGLSMVVTTVCFQFSSLYTYQPYGCHMGRAIMWRAACWLCPSAG